jgi:hypothetical protein
MNRTNVSNYESGRTVPPGNVISAMADILITSSDYLLLRTDDSHPVIEKTPKWATPKDKRDFKKMLEEDGEVMFDGVPMNDAAKQRVLDVLTGLFWEAKEMNKKTYGRKNNKTSTSDEKTK